MEFVFFVLLACFAPKVTQGENREPRILVDDQYTALANKVEQQQKELDQLKAAVKPERVAFKAHLAKSLTPGQNQLLVFDDVRLNVGQAYHHGMFVAPFNGTYLFAVTMCSAGGHYIYVDLLRNGKMIGQVLAGDTSYAACSSETTVVELSVGDDVIVQHHGTDGDYIFANSGVHNSFTGVLLY